MKKNEKIVISILVIITIFAIIMLVRSKSKKVSSDETENQVEEKYVSLLEDGTKLNKSTKLQETKYIDGMEITNFQVTEKDNVTVLLGTITNTSSTVKGDYPVDIKILDDQGNEIVTVGGYIGEIKPGESMQLNSSATFDYANAYDFEIIKK